MSLLTFIFCMYTGRFCEDMGSVADWKTLLVNSQEYKYNEALFTELSTNLDANTVVYYGFEASPTISTLNLIPILFNERIFNIIVHVQDQETADQLNSDANKVSKLLHLLTNFGAHSCNKKLIFAP